MNKLSYSFGVSIAHHLLQSGVNELDMDDFTRAVSDVLGGKDPELHLDEINAVLKEHFMNIQAEEDKKKEEEGKKNKAEGEEFLSANAKNDGVVTTESGLQYKMITEGTGKSPSVHSRVKVHYDGKFISGQKFNSSYDRGEAITFGLNQVISGWTEGLQLMKEGGKCELYIPYNLAYGEVGNPGVIPPCSTLIFTVELLEVL